MSDAVAPYRPGDSPGPGTIARGATGRGTCNPEPVHGPPAHQTRSMPCRPWWARRLPHPARPRVALRLRERDPARAAVPLQALPLRVVALQRPLLFLVEQVEAPRAQVHHLLPRHNVRREIH